MRNNAIASSCQVFKALDHAVVFWSEKLFIDCYRLPGKGLGPGDNSSWMATSRSRSASPSPKQLTIRVDVNNILNHPQLATPNFAVGGTAFGQIATKGGPIFGGGPVQRNLQGQVRLTF